MSTEGIVRGRLRVDPQMAIRKLREHRRANPYAFLGEIVRSAVSAGARRIEVRKDVNRLYVEHDGRVPDASALRRLPSFVFDAAPNERYLRYLLLGINDALAAATNRASLQFRNEGEMLSTILDVKRLELAPEAIPIERAPATEGWFTTRIELSKNLNSFNIGDVLEIDLLEADCEYLDVPLVVTDRRRGQRHPYLRFRLEGPFRRAFLELSPELGNCEAHYLEQGVRLVRTNWLPRKYESLARSDLWLRVVIDAEELATNVSRTELTQKSELFEDFLLVASATIGSLLNGLGDWLRSGTPPDSFEVQQITTSDVESLVCRIIAALSRAPKLPETVLPLLELPLLKNGLGEQVSLRSFHEQQQIHYCTERLPEELSWIAKRLLLIEGRPAETLLADRSLQSAAPLIKRARVAIERRARHLKHAGVSPVLPDKPYLARAEFHDSDGPTRGLRGSVALRGDEEQRLGLHCVILLEGRSFQTVEVGDEFGLAVDMILEWPEGFAANADYEAVEFTSRAYGGLARAVNCAVELLAELIAKDGVRRHRHRVRLAVRALCTANMLRAEPKLPAQLWRARVWPTTEPERYVSLEQLSVFSRGAQVLFASDAGTRAPDHRPLLLRSDPDTERIVRLLSPKRGLVSYLYPDASDAVRADAVRTATASGKQGAGPGVLVRLRDRVAFIRLSEVPTLHWLHQGIIIESSPSTSWASCSIAIDDPHLIVDDAGKILRRQPLEPSELTSKLAEALVLAIEDDTIAEGFECGTLQPHEPAALILEFLELCLQRLTRSKLKGAAELAQRVQRFLERYARTPVTRASSKASRGKSDSHQERVRESVRRPSAIRRSADTVNFERPLPKAPADCVCSYVLEPTHIGRELFARGVLYVPRLWKREPKVRFTYADKIELATLETNPVGRLRSIVPFEGEIELAGGPPRWVVRSQLSRVLMRKLVEIVLSASGAPDPAWLPVMWWLALLGHLPEAKLFASGVNGELIPAAKISAELQLGRPIIVGRSAAEMSPFAQGIKLLDTPCALLTVVETYDRELVRRKQNSSMWNAASEYWRAARDRVAAVSLRPAASDALAASLCTAVHDAIAALNLVGEPVCDVRAAKTGRVVSYDPSRRRVLVNVALPYVQSAMMTDASATVSALVAAAISEINRALVSVTDTEERRTLVTQLYAVARPNRTASDSHAR